MLQKIVLYQENKTGNIFKLIRIEKNFEKEEFFGEQFSLLEGLGDHRPKTLKLNKFNENYTILTDIDKNSVLHFINNNANIHSLPINLKSNEVKFGSIREAYRPYPLEIELPTNEPTIPLNEVNPNNLSNFKIGQMITPLPYETFDNIIIDNAIKEDIVNSLNRIKINDFLMNNWEFDSHSPKKNILNFYGKPGTGKTMSARAIANYLNQKIFQVDYSQVESKWIGETGKNIQKVFEIAKENNALILFDEADSLVSKRTSVKDQVSQHMNLNRNIFMQELDKFDGIVILTTNLFENYDEALLRRINQHIEFILPNETLRLEIFKVHIPKKVPLSECVNFSELAKQSDGLSGGDISGIIKEAIYSIAIKAYNLNNLDNAKLTQESIINQINKINNAKKIHRLENNKNPIGLKIV